MSRLLGRSKSQRHKATRRDQQPDLDIFHGQTSKGNEQNVMTAQVATGAGRWTEAPDIHPRPKTANAASSPSWNVATKGPPIVITADNEVFCFPTPTPRRTNFSPAAAPPPSSPASGMLFKPDDIGIGVAIGSPTQIQHFPSPLSQGLRRQASNDIFNPTKSTDCSNEPREPRHDMNDTSRPKISRWRSLGGFFGRRDRNAVQQSDYQSPRQPESKVDDSSTRSPANECAAQSDHPRETPKRSKQAGKQRRCVEHSATLPKYPSTAPVDTPTSPQRPMLDINIPDVQLERYSVMFSSVLPNRQSNLLARRQGDKGTTLKPLQIPPTPPTTTLRRRATSSPSATSPASYSLFPPSASRKQPSQYPSRSDSILSRPRPLRRTKTSPGAFSAHPFDPLTPMTEASEVENLEERAREALTPTPEEEAGPDTPDDEGNSGTWKIGVALTEEDDGVGWEMITVGKRIEPGDRISVGQVEVQVEEVKDTAGWEREWERSPADRAEVGIARSLSLTKARRGIVRVPMVEEGERVSELKVLTPTVVEMRGRKSVMVEIEDA